LSIIEKLGIPKIIFWDFDGVIKDSVDVKTKAFMHLFESYGSDVVERIRIHHEANGGMSRFKKFPIYLQYARKKVTDSRVNELCEMFGKLVFKNVVDCPWVDGAKDYLLQNRYEQDFYLVSATPTDELKSILVDLGIIKCFLAVYGAPAKKTDTIKMILKKNAILPFNSVMIGDAKADMDAAFLNDVPFILRKHSSNQSLVDDFSGHIINDITEL
jgi:phosphoglycolate phosphatase-like HAD superfamily hydrolase